MKNAPMWKQEMANTAPAKCPITMFQGWSTSDEGAANKRTLSVPKDPSMNGAPLKQNVLSSHPISRNETMTPIAPQNASLVGEIPSPGEAELLTRTCGSSAW
eukprot:CAMPEP_0118955406 /NCGR_PEP_ID=MMETSP1169-20130426/59912_1 /TAXON_ID=36882 /ORGANISM="Pyramimonas obovata, Strain CCMP722" /LENGTH=101 /DNA_ID=CAMNT_0006903245 /DNA_START=607 /DNA_END=909 /DNA_ORIENTATION=-